MLNPEDKLLQNIQSLTAEIGEKQVLLRFFLLVQNTPWQVFQNLGEASYSLLLLNTSTGDSIRVKVKTRQGMYVVGRPRRRIKFSLTEDEYQSCDFLVAYFMDDNAFYVVPKADLQELPPGSLARWRFTLELDRRREPIPECARYRDAWDSIHSDFGKRKI